VIDGGILVGLLALMLSLGVPLERTPECFAMLSSERYPTEFGDATYIAYRIKGWLG